jgi:hypothetical protein
MQKYLPRFQIGFMVSDLEAKVEQSQKKKVKFFKKMKTSPLASTQ